MTHVFNTVMQQQLAADILMHYFELCQQANKDKSNIQPLCLIKCRCIDSVCAVCGSTKVVCLTD